MSTVVQTRLGRVEYAKEGATGPVVLAIHGAMGGFDQGLILARAAFGILSHRAVAPSRPGYLGTPMQSGRTPEQQADLHAALLDALGHDSAVVIAVSGGGQSAVQFALRHPERCGALILVSACTAPLMAKIPFRFHVMKLLARIPGVASRLRAKVARNPLKAAERSIPDPDLRSRTVQHPEAGPLLFALQLSTMEQMATRLPGTENDIAQSRAPFAYPVEQITVPTLILHGAQDEIVPVIQATTLHHKIPASRLMVTQDGAHVTLFTHLDSVRTEVAGFLQSHGV